jgi:hypothetical protein
MAANRTSQDLVERLVDGFLQYDYTEVWQVDASGPAAALQDASLPTIGTQYAISGVSQPVYCYQRQPRRRSDTQAKALFDVICSFTNAVTRYERTVDGLPANEPEQIVPRVDIAFEEFTEQSPTAQFIGVFPANAAASELDPLLSRQVSPFLSPPQFGVEAPIVNSANDPIQNVNKRRHQKRITYWSWHRDWDAAWDDYLDTVNNAEVTITQSDKDGQRLRYTFPKNTLLINDIVKEDHWRDGRLYFRRGVVFAHNPQTWFIQLPDEGFNEMIFEGQDKGGLQTVTADDMDDWFGTDHGEYEHSPIVQFKTPTLTLINFDVLPVPPADPQALNGYGRLLKYQTPDGPSYEPKKLVYMPYTVTDFSPLGIS